MSLIVQLALNTLQIGSVYILFALGLTLVFGVMKVINFAHGQFFTLAALLVGTIMPSLMSSSGLSLWASYLVACAVSLAIVLALAAFVFQIGYRKYLRDLIGSFILSVGLLLLLDGVYLWVFTGVPRVVPNLFPGQVRIAGGVVEYQRLFISFGSALAAALLLAVMKYSKLGSALRAVAEDQEAAALQGIPYSRISLYGFLIGSGLAAIAGCLIAPVSAITPFLGTDYLIKGFIIIILGGLGSIGGAVAAGFAIALVESVVGYVYDPTAAVISMFGLIAVVLLIRPQGMFGHVVR